MIGSSHFGFVCLTSSPSCQPDACTLRAAVSARNASAGRIDFLWQEAETVNLATLDATAQAELVRSREVSATELVEAAIERIEKLAPTLNAVIHRRFDGARAEAKSADPLAQPFPGVPLVLKDAGCQQAGEPHCQGMAALRDSGFRETRDAWLTERFRAAGFAVVGRANAPELCTLPTTEPVAYGATRNPWSLDHSTGGSSGGSAAAVAAGLVPVAHASDGGGSIRMPASCCGLVGLKPSRGRISRGPMEGESWGGLSVEGVVTRSVRDTASVLDCVAGPGVGDPDFAPPLRGSLRQAAARAMEDSDDALRIGVRTEAFGDGDPTHPDCVAATEKAAAALATLGHELSLGGPAALDDERIPTAQGVVLAASLAASLAVWSERIGREISLDELEPVNATAIEAGRALRAVDVITARNALHAYARRVVAWWESFDLLLTPTLTDPPPRLGEVRGDLSAEDGLALGRRFGWLTPPFNITGQPAISLPVHWSKAGLPVGVQLVAAPGREDLLVRVAAQLETTFDWASRRAPCHA
ncbi:MAG: amidase [Deltaproteobacteria bacterium]|nr:amidase [Deltaproteobacteria bacterium]